MMRFLHWGGFKTTKPIDYNHIFWTFNKSNTNVKQFYDELVVKVLKKDQKYG